MKGDLAFVFKKWMEECEGILEKCNNTSKLLIWEKNANARDSYWQLKGLAARIA
jgi:hypothetical protein